MFEFDIRKLSPPVQDEQIRCTTFPGKINQCEICNDYTLYFDFLLVIDKKMISLPIILNASKALKR